MLKSVQEGYKKVTRRLQFISAKHHLEIIIKKIKKKNACKVKSDDKCNLGNHIDHGAVS